MQPAEELSSGAAQGQPDPPAGPKPQESAPAFGAVVQSLLREAWGLVQDHALLVALEAQRAGRNLTRMVFGGVVAAVLMVTAWLALVTALMFWIVGSDTRWAQAFLAVGLIHVVISAVLIAWIRRLAKIALFSAVLRQLRPGDRVPGDGL